uniref:Uncharacterized protein n=1 Tax=Ditylenchus dipsaci TaxID=166011 RepID=A0A915CSU6_9BILA
MLCLQSVFYTTETFLMFSWSFNNAYRPNLDHVFNVQTIRPMTFVQLTSVLVVSFALSIIVGRAKQMSSLKSQGSQSASARKRRHEPIWDNFRKTQLSNHKTPVSRHWESKHKDKQQAAVKIGSRIPEGDIMSKKDLYKFKCSIRCCCNSMHVNKLFAASSIPTSFCTLKGLLNDRCEKRQMQIKADFKNMPQRCSITCDVWSDRGLNNSYLGVTLHYCDQSAVLRRVFLASAS